MTKLNRCYGHGYLHYITTSCYQRRPLLELASRRDLFVEVLEQVRRRYHFVLVGYVVMPEHIHLLLSEPERGNPSKVMQAVKQGFARRILGRLRSRLPLSRTASAMAKITFGNIGSMISSCDSCRNVRRSCTTSIRIR